MKREQVLTKHAAEVQAQEEAYAATSRYLAHSDRALKRGGVAAVRKYQDGVRKRIRRKACRDADALFLQEL